MCQVKDRPIRLEGCRIRIVGQARRRRIAMMFLTHCRRSPWPPKQATALLGAQGGWSDNL
jgi:hypothetical protein